MSLLYPAALALGALSIPIVAMYLLRTWRRERAVSSTLLWSRLLEDLQTSSPLRRFRPNLLLLVQLLTLAALVLVLARPAYSRAESFDGNLILIVDQSYAMQAHDVAPSRFSQALARAHRLVAGVGAGSVVSVIGMGPVPRLAVAQSSDQSALTRAIDGLHVGVDSPDFPASLSLAATLAQGQNARAVVLTSRDSGITGLPFHVSFPVEIDRIGRHLQDLAITAFQAADVNRHTRAVLRVENFGSRTATSDLELYVDGQLTDLRPLTVPPGRGTTEVWTYLPERSERLTARLTRTDDMQGDKVAFAVVHVGSVRHVLLVSRGDYFLQTALALDPSVTLTPVRPEVYRPALARSSDLAVFDAVMPRTLPAASTLLIAPSEGRLGPFTFGAWRAAYGAPPALSANGPLSTLLRYVDLGDVHVARARRLAAPGWLETAIAAGTVPLVAAGDDGSRRLAVMTFNPQESDWPLRVSFPIVVENLLHYLAPGLALGAADLQAGAQIVLYPGPGTRRIEVERPDGTVDRLRPPFLPFSDTRQPGFYLVREIGPTRAAVPFAVNFAPARIHPAAGPDVLRFGKPRPPAHRHAAAPIEVAWACGALALALLVVEWWLGFRR